MHLISEAIIPYSLPDPRNHSFFFIDQHVFPQEEAKLHRHDAWEIICVEKGCGMLVVGDGKLPFCPGTVAMIAPQIPHRWIYATEKKHEKVHYRMVAFEQHFVDLLMTTFPEIRNKFSSLSFPRDALLFKASAAEKIRMTLNQMTQSSEIEQLSEMIRLLDFVFSNGERVTAGKAIQTQVCLKRYQKALEIIMRSYMTPLSLGEIAAEVGMTGNAFSTFFHRQAGMTFSQYLIQYRLNVAADLLLTTKKQISEIIFLCGFRDLPHFSRSFKKRFGMAPAVYRRVRANESRS